jgi:hypothetical protein
MEGTMGDVVKLTPAPRRRPEMRASGPATVLLYTGIRIERVAEPANFAPVQAPPSGASA